MSTFDRPEAIIFDMDGTLFETETLLRSVHTRLFDTLREEGLYTYETPPIESVLACLGMLLDDIWRKIMPESTEAARKRADELFLQYEVEELAAGKGSLYPGTAETLAALKASGIKLFVASNGLESYVKEVARYKGIAEFFDGLYSAGEYKTTSKVDLVAKLLSDHELNSAWMVGDRSSDVEAGKRNGLIVIGCAYAGYGRDTELDGSDALIGSMAELLQLANG
ncbi:HAD family hydrolase [Paenibacillus radicis (ex Gao et al. 2016)]|uniref:MTA/SAH nucleosidase n=1 Tax=Paenibacillus radicis (ex Gao et al. 2016) TaxID=1737354 RepID=A0A917HCS7_9BACL|nr:HAD hydrolase-like protein [Paenibacillus radicis (ex Gao et al. 2016)]GGG74886.1 MTA/SAH nucleosidase [Paenibacillus radicis (ex Gao et al. 2016)]